MSNVAIYNGPIEDPGSYIGFIQKHDLDFEAFDTGEVLLGAFADEDDAADAVLFDCLGVKPRRQNGGASTVGEAPDIAPEPAQEGDGQLTHDKAMASTFLSGLDPTATRFTFQTFDDNKDRKSKALARVLHGTLDECFAELTRLNNLGAGIFVTISETNFLGRSAKNIMRRACALQRCRRRRTSHARHGSHRGARCNTEHDRQQWRRPTRLLRLRRHTARSVFCPAEELGAQARNGPQRPRPAARDAVARHAAPQGSDHTPTGKALADQRCG